MEERRNCQIILGYPITTLGEEECIAVVLRWVEGGEAARYFACANPHSLEVAEDDPVFKDALKQADLLLPDGIGIVIASRLLAGRIRKRITGSDIFRGVSDELNRRGTASYFLLGSTVENLWEFRRKLAMEFPNIRLAGSYSPPFAEDFDEAESARMVAAVNASGADVLWVGMTAPKQEKWAYHNRARLEVRVIGAVGAVFDFYTGSVQRSHPAFQRMGLEWLPRVLREPRRLWRRNLVSNPRFMLRVLRERAALKHSRGEAGR